MTLHFIVIKNACELVIGVFAMLALATIAMAASEYTMLALVTMALIVPIVSSAAVHCARGIKKNQPLLNGSTIG